MAKYSTQFKLDVLQQCQRGEAGIKAIASEHGLHHSMIKTLAQFVCRAWTGWPGEEIDPLPG